MVPLSAGSYGVYAPEPPGVPAGLGPSAPLRLRRGHARAGEKGEEERAGRRGRSGHAAGAAQWAAPGVEYRQDAAYGWLESSSVMLRVPS
jgi:hypothetical protein